MDFLKYLAEIVRGLGVNPDMQELRNDRRRWRFEKRKLKYANRQVEKLEKEFRKNGLTELEACELNTVKQQLAQRKMEFILN